MTKYLIPISTLLILLALSTPANPAFIALDGADFDFFMKEGNDILCVDYLAIFDNCVTRSGRDYPNAVLIIELYHPKRYEKADTLNEEDWDENDRLVRYEIPGPGENNLWGNDDYVVYRNLGLYNWSRNNLDRVVFRIYAEQPADSYPADTVIWGVLHKNMSFTTQEYTTDIASLFLRTTNLPETFLIPYADINDAWMVHEVKKEGLRGLELHLNFDVGEMRSFRGRIAAYLRFATDYMPASDDEASAENQDDDAEAVSGTYRANDPVPCQIGDPVYNTPSGNITVQSEFLPIYDATTYTDFALFIPYDAFPISDDFIDYYFSIEILDDELNLIGSGKSPVFSVWRP